MPLLRVGQTLLDLVFSLRPPLPVQGPSMTPTLGQGQWLLTRTVRFSWNCLGRGDIVVFRNPVRGSSIFVKRIVGLPGEYVQMEDGGVRIDGQLLEEVYLAGPTLLKERYPRKWFNGSDEYFLLGDNRNDSQDSRLFGPVARRYIIGRVWLRCWPPGSWGTVPGGRRYGR